MLTKILSIIGVAFLLLLGFSGNTYAQSAYGSNSYGSCVYGDTNGCGGQSSSNQPTVVILNNNPLYNNPGPGVELSMVSGSGNPVVVEFYTLSSNGKANPNSLYQIYVVSTNDSSHSTVLRFIPVNNTAGTTSASAPKEITITQGQTVFVDANNDGIVDISIRLYGEANGIDELYFHVAVNKSGRQGNGGHAYFNATGPSNRANGGNNSPAAIIKKIIDAIPDVAIVTLPQLLLLLLILIAIWAAYQAVRERKYLKTINRLLDNLKLLGKEKGNFLDLSAHYLRTPLTQIAGGVELLASLKTDPPLATRLQNDVNGLKSTIGSILAKAGGDSNLSELSANPTVGERLIKSTASVRIWIMVTVIGVIIVLTDTIVRNAKHLSVINVDVITQLTLYALLVAAIYSALRYYQIHVRMRKENEKVVAQQNHLDEARSLLIEEVGIEAAPHINALINAVPQLPANNLATKAMGAGLKTFQNILNEFTILANIKQNNPGNIRQLEINAAIDRVLDSYQEALNSKKITLNFNRSNTPLNIQLNNPLLIKQLVGSLVDNAIKFSPENGQINLSLNATRNSLQLTISDNGIGITKENLQRLFEPFSRAEMDDLKFNYEGMGFNLYLDKIIVDSLGGNISVDSTVNEGTVVTLQIPIRQDLDAQTISQLTKPQLA